jgi:hypothetical protein
LTLQNLGKIIDQYESQLGSTNTEQPELLRGLPFYDFEQHARNSFNDAIGLPEKNELVDQGKSSSLELVNHAQNRGISSISFNHAIGLPEKNGVAYPLV